MSGRKHVIASSFIKCYTLARARALEVRQPCAHQYLPVEELMRLIWLKVKYFVSVRGGWNLIRISLFAEIWY